MNTNSVLANSEKYIKWFRYPEARYFLSDLEDAIRVEQSKLESSVVPSDMYRAQGALRVLKVIHDLKETVINYENEVLSGKVREVTSRRQ